MATPWVAFIYSNSQLQALLNECPSRGSSKQLPCSRTKLLEKPSQQSGRSRAPRCSDYYRDKIVQLKDTERGWTAGPGYRRGKGDPGAVLRNDSRAFVSRHGRSGSFLDVSSWCGSSRARTSKLDSCSDPPVSKLQLAKPRWFTHNLSAARQSVSPITGSGSGMISIGHARALCECKSVVDCGPRICPDLYIPRRSEHG